MVAQVATGNTASVTLDTLNLSSVSGAAMGKIIIGPKAMAADSDTIEHDKARRFGDATLPYLDDVYTLACHLMRNVNEAEDSVQECYLRASRQFDSYRGPAMKPWLLAILRGVCNAELTRHSKHEIATAYPADETAANAPPVLCEHETTTIRWRVATLPQPFREAIVLREINELSYQQIAQVAGVPVATVKSRVARARSMLRSAWNAPKG